MTESAGWQALAVFNYVVLAYFVALNSVYLATSLFAFGALRKYARRLKFLDVEDLMAAAGAPPITLIAPAYNEEATCVEATRSLLTLKYPEYDIVVVNDGSTDRTLERLIQAFELAPSARMPLSDLPTAPIRKIYQSRRHPNLWVVDKDNGGKADALNAGINFARTPLFCAMDADSLLEREALTRIVRPFLEDASTIATGGIIRIVNGCTVKGGEVTEVALPGNLLARFQVLEYLRAFLSGRMGWGALNATLVISGAFGLFRRASVVDAGGFATDTVGEDMELVVRLHRYYREQRRPYRITFVPDPVAWTECPETLRVLGRQRDRWQRGLAQSLVRHARMLGNPAYGRIGLVAFPYFFFLEMLGPLIEVGGYGAFALTVAAGRASGPYVAAFLAVAVVLGMVLSIAAVGLEELTFRRYPRVSDLFRLFGLAALENLGYRQLVTWWRFKGLVSAVRGVKGWGAMERKGFAKSAAVLAAICAAHGAAAQTATPPRWRAGATAGYEAVTPDRSDWLAQSVFVARTFARGAVAAELHQVRRFDLWDRSAVVDFYHRAGQRASINLRAEAAPGAEVVPQAGLLIEMYQSVGNGLEVSASYRLMGFRDNAVHLFGGSVAKYLPGAWYVRLRGALVPEEGKVGGFIAGTLRRSLGSADQLAELQGGLGSEVVLIGAGPTVAVQKTRFIAVRYQQFLLAGAGILLSAGYTNDVGVQERAGGTAGLMFRW